MASPGSPATLLTAPRARLGAWASSWPAWWAGLPARRRAAPALAVAAWWAILIYLDHPRPDHIALGIAVLALGYGGRAANRLLAFLLPIFLTGVVYDSQRLLPALTLGPVRVVEPYEFDRRWFGIGSGDAVQTPNEWLQQRTHPALDFLAGFYYLTYVGQFALIAAWFHFRLARTGTARRPAPAIAGESLRLVWGFFWLNLIGYFTYHVYPAAPPWYVAEHGLGPARLDTPPNPGGCVRFDALLGTDFFTAMYSRSADVFGAIPSLHVAYPLLAAWYAFKYGSLRAYSLLFFAMMCFAAVYLNHHYVIDVIIGAAYALAVAVAMDRLLGSRRAAAA